MEPVIPRLVQVVLLGGELLLDRSDDEEEPLRVYADPHGHPFCVFVPHERAFPSEPRRRNVGV